jgi:hypothetical protein
MLCEVGWGSRFERSCSELDYTSKVFTLLQVSSFEPFEYMIESYWRGV